jgi:hypothetical protein
MIPAAAKAFGAGVVQRRYPTAQQDADPDRSREGEGDDHPRATVRTPAALAPDQIAYEQPTSHANQQ